MFSKLWSQATRVRPLVDVDWLFLSHETVAAAIMTARERAAAKRIVLFFFIVMRKECQALFVLVVVGIVYAGKLAVSAPETVSYKERSYSPSHPAP